MNTTDIIVRITCGFLITVCSIGLIMYFLIAKDFIEDYLEDKKEEKENEESNI